MKVSRVKAPYDTHLNPASPASHVFNSHLDSGASCGQLQWMNVSLNNDGDPRSWEKLMAESIHDLRTPLSSMRVALEVLRLSGADSEKREKLIDILSSQVDELAGILNRLPKEWGLADHSPGESL